MSNVIDFLERLGQDADLCHSSRDMLEEALRAADIDPVLRNAILGNDRSAFEALLGVQSNVCCLIWKEDEEEEAPEEEEEDEDDEDEEDKD